MFYITAAVIIIGLCYLGWKLTSRTAYESAEYTVLKQDGAIELREYPDLMLATTGMTNTNGNDGSFGRLFRYISGGNQEKQKVAMTTPVFMELQTESTDGLMSFVIPKNVAESDIPGPASSEVSLTKRAGGKFAAIRFTGQLNEETGQQHLAKLNAWVQAQGDTITGTPEFAGYDPPWTPGPLRRNEVLIRIK